MSSFEMISMIIIYFWPYAEFCIETSEVETMEWFVTKHRNTICSIESQLNFVLNSVPDSSFNLDETNSISITEDLKHTILQCSSSCFFFHMRNRTCWLLTQRGFSSMIEELVTTSIIWRILKASLPRGLHPQQPLLT